MRGFAPNLLISQPERLPRSVIFVIVVVLLLLSGHVDIFSSVSLSENRHHFKHSNVYTSCKRVLRKHFLKQNRSKSTCLMCRHFKTQMSTHQAIGFRVIFSKQNQSKPACLMCRQFKTQMSTHQAGGFWDKTVRNKIDQNPLAWCVDISKLKCLDIRQAGFESKLFETKSIKTRLPDV